MDIVENMGKLTVPVNSSLMYTIVKLGVCQTFQEGELTLLLPKDHLTVLLPKDLFILIFRPEDYKPVNT